MSSLLKPRRPRVEPSPGPRLRSSATLQGYLQKQNPHGIKSYKKRWFVLRGREIQYYEKDTDVDGGKPLGVIELERVERVDGKKNELGFTIFTPKRDFILQAYSRDERAAWVATLRRLLQAGERRDSKAPLVVKKKDKKKAEEERKEEKKRAGEEKAEEKREEKRETERKASPSPKATKEKETKGNEKESETKSEPKSHSPSPPPRPASPSSPAPPPPNRSPTSTLAPPRNGVGVGGVGRVGGLSPGVRRRGAPQVRSPGMTRKQPPSSPSARRNQAPNSPSARPRVPKPGIGKASPKSGARVGTAVARTKATEEAKKKRPSSEDLKSKMEEIEVVERRLRKLKKRLEDNNRKELALLLKSLSPSYSPEEKNQQLKLQLASTMLERKIAHSQKHVEKLNEEMQEGINVQFDWARFKNSQRK